MRRLQSIAFIICLALTCSLNAGSVAAQDVQSSGIKLQSTLVSIPVIVSDRQGRYISGLQVSDFILYKDRVKRSQIATELPVESE